MEIERIGYRYTQAELAVLMSLQGRQEIAGLPLLAFPDKEEFRQGMLSLEEDGILSNVNGTILVDKVRALMMQCLCSAEKYVTVTQGGSCAGLYACSRMAQLLLCTSAGQWTVLVAQESMGLKTELLRQAEGFSAGGEVRLSGQAPMVFDSGEDLMACVRKALCLMEEVSPFH